MTPVLRFMDQQHEAENATSFLFQPDSPLTFRAGQYLRYTLPHADPDTRGISRSFSIASSPDEPLLRLTTRLSTPPSTFKAALARLQPGAIVDASGPFGNFVYSESDEPVVFIAGGIGITPMRSILGDLASRQVRTRSTLLYSSTTQDIPFRTWLDALATDWPELRVIYTVTRPGAEWNGLTGRIDAAFVQRHVPDVARSLCLVSGPTPLVDSMRATLADTGVDPGRVKYEAFPGYHVS
ncbi:MAG TPA: FAD-dependent oxidoreductase [Ktedonobacterales bacterium]|nr:FAD-dependent oxidoreductase [Ktedonobacterales bacterium]